MKKKKVAQKTTSLRLQTETLGRLGDSQLEAVVGGARAWKPLGFSNDTTPIYDETAG